MESDKAEFEGFINIDILRPVFYNEIEHAGTCIFKFRIICEIKDLYTDKLCKKLRLVVQGYGDNDKYSILI